MGRIASRVGGAILLVAVFLSTTLINAADELPKDLKDIDIDTLKAQLPDGFLPPEFQNISLPSIEDIQKIVKDKCSKIAGNEEAYEKTEAASQRLGDCMKGLIDFGDLQEEIQKAKPTGDLDTVFNKYCKRRAAAIECVDTFSADIDVCLDDEERESKRVFVNLVHGLLNFGPECFQEQKQPLIDCFNGTLRGYLDESTPKPSEGIPKLVMGQKQCDDMDNLRACFVRVLEDCQESTPANLVESMFKFVRRETPCANFTVPAETKKGRRNSSDALQSSAAMILLTTWLVAMVAKLVVH
ncbi:hypothetical protein pipiens_007578 [Culex pipiens pipiens]|uniref:27 kDa hemolymph protein n=2 Tax=Culex pipiens TaxID=7175 RepID=A0ABD1DKK2_CULPP